MTEKDGLCTVSEGVAPQLTVPQMVLMPVVLQGMNSSCNHFLPDAGFPCN